MVSVFISLDWCSGFVPGLIFFSFIPCNLTIYLKSYFIFNIFFEHIKVLCSRKVSIILFCPTTRNFNVTQYIEYKLSFSSKYFIIFIMISSLVYFTVWLLFSMWTFPPFLLHSIFITLWQYNFGLYQIVPLVFIEIWFKASMLSVFIKM